MKTVPRPLCGEDDCDQLARPGLALCETHDLMTDENPALMTQEVTDGLLRRAAKVRVKMMARTGLGVLFLGYVVGQFLFDLFN